MQGSSISKKSSADLYWRNCWLDTERQIAAATNADLRTVYGELLVHYQRMAERYDARQLDTRSN